MQNAQSQIDSDAVTIRMKEFIRSQGTIKDIARDLNVPLRSAASWYHLGNLQNRPRPAMIDKMIVLYGPAFIRAAWGPLLDQNPEDIAKRMRHIILELEELQNDLEKALESDKRLASAVVDQVSDTARKKISRGVSSFMLMLAVVSGLGVLSEQTNPFRVMRTGARTVRVGQSGRNKGSQPDIASGELA